MPTTRKIVFGNDEYYHVFNRGVEKRPVFTNKYEFLRALDVISFYRFDKPQLRYSKYMVLDSQKRDEFLDTLIEKAVEIIAFCLMSNHFHFLLKQVKENGTSRFVSNFTNSYTKYFNTKHKRVGPLFQGIFKAVHVESDEQLLHLSRYIHLNPVTGFIIKPEDLGLYKWSSYLSYIDDKAQGFIDKDIVMNFFKKTNDYEAFVLDQADYARSLRVIEHLNIEE